jgi:arylsulfatase A-like enzyme
MGTANDQHPNELGFSEWWGFLSGGHLYYPDDHPSYHGKYLNLKKPWGMRDMHHCLPILHNRERVEWTQYLTRELTDQGIRFMEKNRDKPFFLFMSYNAPHEYLEAPEETKARFPANSMTVIPGVKPKDRAVYGAMVDELDRGVGRLLAFLGQLGLSDHTIVWFLSDNGGMKRTSDNRPLRGNKWDSYEGGLRVPFVVSWPGRVKPGAVLEAPVTALDIGATSVALAGGDPSKAGLDGSDITGYMTGGTTDAPHDEIFWRIGRSFNDRSGVLRVGDFKLIIHKSGVELYDLKNDLAETTDLSQAHPERVRVMLERWKSLNQSSKPPLWKPLTAKEQMKDEYQYQDYEWLKGTPHYRASQK